LQVDARSGSKGDLTALKFDFRFTTGSGLKSDVAACLKGAPDSDMGTFEIADKEKAARRRLLNSNLMIADQAAINVGLNLRPSDAQQQNGYFNEVLIELNIVFRLLPSPLTMAMIASAIPAAISPYSIAVAPDSSDMNFKRLYFKPASLRLCGNVQPRKSTDTASKVE
jgi:hypothetical protein